MAIDIIAQLVQEIDDLDTEIKNLATKMATVAQEKTTTIINIQVLVIEWSSKAQIRILKYTELQELVALVLWAYQSLISAQSYYIKFFSDDHLDFWRTVSAGSSILFIHIIQLYFPIYKLGFPKRVISAFVGYIIVDVLVMPIKNNILLIIAFATVGGLNTFTESPIYGIAGLFSTGSFSQAVQVGTGMAGFLNVIASIIIRLIVLLFHSDVEDQLSFYIFMIKIRINQQMASFQQEKCDDVVELYLVGNKHSFWKLVKILKIHLFVQFYVVFISLALWSGIPCGVIGLGWFN